MRGASRILFRFVTTTIMISTLLLVVNYIFLGTLLFKGMNEHTPPSQIPEAVADTLKHEHDGYVVELDMKEQLDQHQAWAMLIDSDGQVAWSYSLPDELPRSYSLIDVAKFSRHYLDDYPVFVWEHTDGLIVVGYPKQSLAKYLYTFPIAWVERIPVKVIGLYLANIVFGLLLALYIGGRLTRSISPLLNGINALAEGKDVYVTPKGVLRDVAMSLNRMSKLLKEKNRALNARDAARTNWIAGISHDIRTPLSMILGHASDLEENEHVPAEQRKQAEIIRKQGEKLRTLISDLNLVSQLEYDMQPIRTKVLKVSALIRQCASDYLNQGLDERYTFDLEIEDEQLKVKGDEKLLLRAITNLIQNCIDHNPEGCRIRLQTGRSADGNMCRITVWDNGQGMEKIDFHHVTKWPYAPVSENQGQSRGLGLPMVARIAHVHHGELRLTSEQGYGLKAEVILPLV